MEILQLRYFCDAAKTQNFSKTAAKFRVPTSNISQTVKRLEKELGAELFEHRSNSVLLNETGKVYYENISCALELIDNAGLKVRDCGISGEIRLLVTSNRRKVTDIIEKFRKSFPDVTFSISHSSESEDFDLIITSDAPDERRFNNHLLLNEEIHVAIGKNHHLAKCDSVNLSALANERFVVMNSSSLMNVTTKACNRVGFSPNVVIRTDDPFYVRKYVEMELGIAFVPSVSWKGQFADTVVCKRLAENICRKTYVMWNKEKYLTKASKAFLRMLIDTDFQK